jgi:hypothetical protein
MTALLVASIIFGDLVLAIVTAILLMQFRGR